MLEFVFRDLLGALDFHARIVREYKNVNVQVTDRKVTVMSTKQSIVTLAQRMRGELVK